MAVTRYRGDTYPMEWTLKIDTVLISWSGADEVSFTYNKDEATQIVIDGVFNVGTDGIVTFSPIATDFDTVGVFTYDVQVVFSTGIIQTFDKDTLTIEDDVKKL